jgi:hypothetical protein
VAANYGLNYVRRLIHAKPIEKRSSSNLTVVLQSLLTNFSPNNDYKEAFYIVFVSQALNQQIVDEAQPFADKLRSNGRLTLIGLDNPDNDEYLYTLSPYATIWPDPNNNPVLPDWMHFFWADAYGCSELNAKPLNCLEKNFFCLENPVPKIRSHALDTPRGPKFPFHLYFLILLAFV